MKTFKWIMIIILILLVLVISPFIVSPVINNITLSSFSKQLFQIDIPNTKVLERHSICGKLNGNGNGMDYLACVLVETDLSYEELKFEFSSKKFKEAKLADILQYGGHKKTQSVNIDVVKVDNGKLETGYLEHGEIEFGNRENFDDYSKYYALVIYDGGYSAGFDLRGN